MNAELTTQTLELLESQVFGDIDKLYSSGKISQYDYYKITKTLCEYLDQFRESYNKYARVYGEK